MFLKPLKTNRIFTIDILKGFGIILMVLGHMHFSSIFDKFVYGFHMPLFFFISGYLYREQEKNELRGYSFRKAKSLLIPYFSVGIFYSIAMGFIKGKYELMKGFEGVFFSTTHNMPIESALWFLLALFWASLLYAVMDSYLKNRVIIIVCIVFITVTGCIWLRFFHYLPWGINSAMSVMGFFALGHFYRLEGETYIKNYFDNKNRYFIMIGIFTIMVLFGLLIMLNGRVNIRVGTFGFFPIAYLNAVVYILALFLMASILSNNNDIESLFQSSGYKIYFINVLSKIGEASMIYVCFNHPVLKICRKLLFKVGLRTVSFTEVFLEFLLAMVTIYLLYLLIKKSPAKFIFYPKTK